jgi:hypothetical protein
VVLATRELEIGPFGVRCGPGDALERQLIGVGHRFYDCSNETTKYEVDQ